MSRFQIGLLALGAGALALALWFAYGYHRYEKYGNTNLILDTRTGQIYTLDGHQVGGGEPR